MDRPMLTREDQIYKARIAADLLEYNVNIRKVSAYPKPSKSLLKPYVVKSIEATGGGARAEVYRPEGLEVLALASLVIETRGSVVFSGGMGTGKTTQLNQLLYLTPPWFQVVVVERGAREIWAPLGGQMLHLSVPSEDRLWMALDQAASLIAKLEAQLTALEAQRRALEEALRQRESEVTALQANLRAAQAENERLKTQLAQLKAENDQLKAKLASMNQTLARLNDQLASLKTQLAAQLSGGEEETNPLMYVLFAALAGVIAAFVIYRKKKAEE